MRSVSDLILGLPGETLESHLSAIRGLVNSRTHELHNFQAMLLKGTELESAESRRKFRFESRFRVLPKQFGQYDGQKVFDMDEIVVKRL
jgi:radical SAM superfamily enzyme